MKGDFIALNTELWRKLYKMLLSGLKNEAVWYIKNCNNGGILQPDETDAKTGHLVMETLHDKHPALWQRNLDDSSCKSFEIFKKVLILLV